MCKIVGKFETHMTVVSRFTNLLKFINATMFFISWLIITWIAVSVNEYLIPSFFNKILYPYCKILFLHVITGTFYLLSMKKFYVCMDKHLYNTKKLIILSNHLSEFDFVFVCRVLFEMNLVNDLIFIMKKSLCNLPFFGDICTIFGFIGITRGSETATTELHEGLLKIKRQDQYTVVLFPEGTIWTLPIYNRTLEFCKSNNITPNTWCLIPRPKGATMIFNELVDKNTKIANVALMFNPFAVNISPMLKKFEYLVFRSDEININFVITDSTQTMHKNNYLQKSFKNTDKILKAMHKTHIINSKDEFIKMLESCESYDPNIHDIYELSNVTWVNCILIVIYIFGIYKLLF